MRIVRIYIKWILITMPNQRETETANTVFTFASSSDTNSSARIQSEDLFQQKREIEIEHTGRIDRL